jgi:hypothetical protein
MTIVVILVGKDFFVFVVITKNLALLSQLSPLSRLSLQRCSHCRPLRDQISVMGGGDMIPSLSLAIVVK